MDLDVGTTVINMNCFEWQNHSSDFLDGFLSPSLQTRAENHLRTCVSCQQKERHYRRLIEKLSELPVHALSEEETQSHLLHSKPLRSQARTDPRNLQWKRAPWFIRTSVEGVGIALIVLFVVVIIPQIHSLYQKNLERRLETFDLAQVPLDPTEEVDLPLNETAVRSSANTSTSPTSTASIFSPEALQDETDPNLADDTVAHPEKASPKARLQVGENQICRFIIRTDSPQELRPKITQLFVDLGVPKDSKAVRGLKVPGGIQFIVLVPMKKAEELKNALDLLTQTLPRSQSPLADGETYTWYSSKSRKPIPAGQTQIVVWLSQI